ncbi:MAG TPA: DUF2155 domain-containing protein [Rhodospirillales bacterium]|nr:DUF2155 domain-containing protein [Rhodospirillales bacterium]HJO87506.1 DUF2155 domain-containing protein [Rhodospirillales bacterium]
MIHFLKSVTLLVTLLAFGAANAQAEQFNIAILQGLDKVTARVSTFPAPIGQTVKFGTLEIIARTCDKRPPEETPESAAFLDVWEVRPGEPAASVYRGWMFASSPALAAMEHPVYDVWVLDCKSAVYTTPK